MSLPFDFATLKRSDLRGVGLGMTSEVVRLGNTDIVAKKPSTSDFLGPEVHEIEKKIYERLAQSDHPNILKYLGQSPPECKLLRSALLFQYHHRGTLIDCLPELKTISGRRSWPYQAVSAVAFIHSRGIVHADLGLHNFLLADDGRIVLCDFSGSGLDGNRSYVAHGTRYSNPLFAKKLLPTSEQDDIFALGSLLYELDRGEKLFKNLSDAEIHERLLDKQFPDLSTVSLPLRDVIMKCWTVSGYKAADALRELEPQSPASRDRPFYTLLGFGLGVCALSISIWKLSSVVKVHYVARNAGRY